MPGNYKSKTIPDRTIQDKIIIIITKNRKKEKRGKKKEIGKINKTKQTAEASKAGVSLRGRKFE